MVGAEEVAMVLNYEPTDRLFAATRAADQVVRERRKTEESMGGITVQKKELECAWGKGLSPEGPCGLGPFQLHQASGFAGRSLTARADDGVGTDVRLQSYTLRRGDFL